MVFELNGAGGAGRINRIFISQFPDKTEKKQSAFRRTENYLVAAWGQGNYFSFP
jgi:hypothetical protein